MKNFSPATIDAPTTRYPFLFCQRNVSHRLQREDSVLYTSQRWADRVGCPTLHRDEWRPDTCHLWQKKSSSRISRLWINLTIFSLCRAISSDNSTFRHSVQISYSAIWCFCRTSIKRSMFKVNIYHLFRKKCRFGSEKIYRQPFTLWYTIKSS